MLKAVCGKDRCSGCGACRFVCPKGAVVWQKDACGHLTAFIEEAKCIRCGRCRNVCPSLHPAALRMPQQCYALWAKDEQQHVSSSSGGAASLLSDYFIRQGNVVYGSAVLPGGKVKHIRVDRAEDLPKLKGSKYVQSDCSDVYALIRRDLQAGKKVLFTGTPCQNAGILNVFGKEEGLYAVNLVCHGVPSAQLLEEQLRRDVKTPEAVTSLTFRKGNKFGLTAFHNEQILYTQSLDKERWKNVYMELFLRNVSFRSGCYECRYACPERAGDMTIGDFWGLGKQRPFPYDTTRGCSVVTCQSKKGQELLAAIAPYAFFVERDYSEAVAGNKQLSRPAAKTVSVLIFRKLYPAFGLHRAGLWACLPQYIKYRLARVLHRG